MSDKKRGLMNSVRRFWGEDQGSITIQVLTFSFLLLATTGLVLDSGRLYTQHSQLQAYTDQMALAAANELDSQPNSIERAANAVFGQNGNNPYLRKAGIELGEFTVKTVYFYSAMAPSDRTQNDMQEAFPSSALIASWTAGDDIATYYNNYDGTSGPSGVSGPQAALYAVVWADEEATKSSLVGLTQAVLSMGSDPDPDRNPLGQRPEFSPNLSFGTVAAASVERRTCAEVSTLVFCNPWEDVSSGQINPLEQDPESPDYSFTGRSLMHFAGNFSRADQGYPMPQGSFGSDETQFGSAYDWDLPHQLFTLKDPIADESEACSPDNVPLLFNNEDYEIARDRCLMARAQADQVCWGEDSSFTVQPAHGPDVVRSINTAFDIWHEPFQSVLTTRPATQLPGTGIELHQAFEPDMLAVTMFETADWYGDVPGTEQDGDVTQEFADSLLPGNPASLDAFLAHLTPHPEMRFASSADTSANTVSSYGRDICHENTYRRMNSSTPDTVGGACAQDFVGDHYAGNSVTTSQARSDMDSYWADTYDADDSNVQVPPGGFRIGRRPVSTDAACGVQSFLDTTPGLADYCGARNLGLTNADGGALDTWYEVYLSERAALVEDLTGNSLVQIDSERTQVTAPIDPQDENSPPRGRWGNASGIDETNGEDNPNDPDNMSRYSLVNNDEYYVQRRPDDYFADSTSTALNVSARERRRIRSAMVNCQAMVADANFADDDQDSFDNEYIVRFEDIRVVDVYLPHPAMFHCGEFPAGDANAGISRPTCDLDASTDTVLYSEMIRDVTDDATSQQFIAKLVR